MCFFTKQFLQYQYKSKLKSALNLVAAERYVYYVKETGRFSIPSTGLYCVTKKTLITLPCPLPALSGGARASFWRHLYNCLSYSAHSINFQHIQTLI